MASIHPRIWAQARAFGFVFVAILLACLLLGYCYAFLLLSFAAILVGVVLHRSAVWVGTRLRMPHAWALTVVLVVMAATAIVAGLALAPEISSQINTLSESLPKAYRDFLTQVEALPWAKRIWHSVMNPANNGEKAILAVPVVLAHLSEMIGAALYVFFGGVFLAGAPEIYLENVLKVVPQARREKWREAAVAAADNLTSWVRAQLVLMVVVGGLTVAGLMILKVPMALTLGLMTALLLFVPYTGAVASAIPAILVAMMTSAKLALYTVGVYTAAHLVEAYIVGPVVQRKMLSMPPAVVLAAELLLGYTWGILGIALATPVFAVLLTFIEKLYLERLEHGAYKQPIAIVR